MDTCSWEWEIELEPEPVLIALKNPAPAHRTARCRPAMHAWALASKSKYVGLHACNTCHGLHWGCSDIIKLTVLPSLPILCVRCARWEREIQRERERERERESERRKWRHLSSAEIGDEFCIFPCQKFAPQYWQRVLHFSCQKFAPYFLSSWRALSSHFPLPKTLRSSKQFAFFILLLSNGVTGDRSTKTNDRISCWTVLLIEKKKWIKLIPKTIGNRKRDCAWGCSRGINTTWENLQIETHKSGGVLSDHWTDLWFSQVVFIPREQPHAQSLFLFPIVFGINIHLLCWHGGVLSCRSV